MYVHTTYIFLFKKMIIHSKCDYVYFFVTQFLFKFLADALIYLLLYLIGI